jgi:hypothetical protein
MNDLNIPKEKQKIPQKNYLKYGLELGTMGALVSGLKYYLSHAKDTNNNALANISNFV